MPGASTLVVDIETVGQDASEIPERASEIMMAGLNAEEQTAVRERFGLDPCTGRIVCVGLYWLEVDRSRAYCQTDERELLSNFWADLAQVRPTRFVTFNGKSFDFPYIIVRSAILGVMAPRDVLLDTRRFATDRHFDVREALTNYDRYRKGTLEYFCQIFGVASPKNGMDGSHVGEYYKAGRIDEIAEYCLADCRATGALYERIRHYYR